MLRVAEKPKSPATSAPPSAGGQPAPAPPPLGLHPSPETGWRSVWQLPALIGAILLLTGGIAAAIWTAPKVNFDKVFDQVQALIEHEDYATALDVLNKRLLPYYNANQLGPLRGQKFHLLRARSVYLGDKKLGVENEKNAEQVVEEYVDATPEGASLEVRDQYFLADANVTLGRFDRAMQLANALPGTERANKGRIVKRVVERRLEMPAVDADETLRLLADFLRDQELTVADKAWALARQAELLLRQGLAERAIAKLVQTMPALLAEAGPDRLAELYMLLGRAYWESGALTDAARQLEQVTTLLIDTDARRAEAEVLLARIHEQTRQPPEEARADAKQRYESVVQRFATAPAELSALLGLGEVCAALGDMEGSFRAYDQLVKEMGSGRKSPDLTVQTVAMSLLDRFSARLDAGDLPGALRYATLAEKPFPVDAVPPEVLLAVASAHRRSAEAHLKEPGAGNLAELASLDPATREQTRLDLLSAARYFKRHADRVGITDNTAYGNSLWMAADSADLAGDPEQAIPLFRDYVKYFPSEARQAEARFRLGQSYQARGDYGTAAGFYRGLKDEKTGTGRTAGPYADMSYVPLAQCLKQDADPANDAEAEQLLETVVRGAVGDTTSPQYRDALVELGGMKRKRGDFAAAISHLEEAVARFPGDPKIDDLRYQLADSYRQDSRAIAKKLADEGMPDNRKQALQEARLERLRKGQDLFEQVRRSLDGRDARRLTRLEQLELRNSYFYLGDCAFDLKDYDTAIHHYDAARERYPKDPASLVAMMQIVNSYLELGDRQRAATAQNRAMAFYESLPATSWEDPNLPMDKDDWKRWLESTAKLRPLSPEERHAVGEAPER